MVEFSVVIPVYNCGECLHHLHERVTRSLSSLCSTYELIFVEDRGQDDSWAMLEELSRLDPHVKALRLSRNFGQHAAITAGLAEARGRWVVVMDCDLQDPPEDIPALHSKALEGYDIVFAKRIYPGGFSCRRSASRLYSRLMKVMFGVAIDMDFGNFSIVSRKVVNAFLSVRDRDRHYLMILHWLGFTHTSVPFQRAERFAGESAYTVGGLIRFAVDGLFFQTTILLRWIVYLGFLLSFIGAGLAAFFVYFHFANNSYPGWTSLAVLLLLIGGFIITSMGVTGLYIGKIFAQVKERPLYIVDAVADPATEDDRVPRGDRRDAEVSTVES